MRCNLSTVWRQPRGLPLLLEAGKARLFGMAVLAVLAVSGDAWATTPASGEIQVAVVATRGSPHQPYGGEVISGAEAVAARLNAAGGVLGQPVRIVGWSEDCTRVRALQIAEEVVRLKPALVIGHLCAGAALAAVPLYAKAGIPVIVPGVRHPALNRSPSGHPLIFRLAGRDDRFAAETVRFINQQHPGEKVAIVADRTQQGSGLGASVAAELVRQKAPPVHYERLESGEKSYAGVAARIKASGASVVVMPAQPVELGVVVAGLRQAGVTATLVGSEILAVPAIEATARQEGARLVLMLPWTGLERGLSNPDESEAEGGHFASHARLAARARAEAALQVWAGAVSRAGTIEASQVAAALRSAPTETSVGPLGFDADGDAHVPSYLAHVWREGGWRAVGR